MTAQQTINVGSYVDDTSADTLRAAFIKCNNNFTAVWNLGFLGYTPANVAGDTFSGAVTFSSTATVTGLATFNGLTTFNSNRINVPNVDGGNAAWFRTSTADDTDLIFGWTRFDTKQYLLKVWGAFGFSNVFTGTVPSIGFAQSATGTLSVYTSSVERLSVDSAGLATLTSAGLVIKPASGLTSLWLDGVTGTTKLVKYRTANSLRWEVGQSGTAESGANAGSNFVINRYDDSGAALDVPVSINRASGDVTVLNNLTVSKQIARSVARTITAAGANQGTATALASGTAWHEVTTTGAGTGVILPAVAAGQEIVVFNRGANALLVYPASGGTINALSANAGFSVASAGTATLRAVSSTQIYAS